MTVSDSYRTRVQDVRRAARARLAEIRAERVAKSRPSAPPAVEQGPEAPLPSGLGFTASPGASRLAALAIEQPPEPEPELIAEQALEPEPAPELEPEAEPAPESQAAGLPPERLVEPSAAGEPDLDRLPGIGPGLVWILQQSGVRSLADLAAFEPSDLRVRVGFVGALVNLEAWIAFARQSVEGGGS